MVSCAEITIVASLMEKKARDHSAVQATAETRVWVGIGLWWGSLNGGLLEVWRCDPGTSGTSTVVLYLGNNSTLCCCEFESTNFSVLMRWMLSKNTKHRSSAASNVSLSRPCARSWLQPDCRGQTDGTGLLSHSSISNHDVTHLAHSQKLQRRALCERANSI
jgi:hypothetical protein